MARRIKKQVYKGTTYRSGFEKQIAEGLDKQGVKFKYEEDVITYVEPARTKKYTPDFQLPNGIIVEAKGRWTLHDRKKMVLVIEQNPKLDIRMLFQRDQFLNKGSKTRYSEWCQKRGIKCAVGELPEEWLKGTKETQE
jgi:hypothetical protein